MKAVFDISLSELMRKLRSPLDGVMWGCDPIQHDHVISMADSIRAGESKAENRSWQDVCNTPEDDGGVGFHVQRVATLLLQDHASADPIQVILRRVGLGRCAADLQDGQHRLAAALIGDHSTIAVQIRNLTDMSTEDAVRSLFPSAELR